MRQDHKAGEKLFVDFPGLTIPIYDERDLRDRLQAELFVAVLGASNYLFAEALRSQQLEHWVAAHVAAFEFFGGVPEIVVSDNLRSAVTKAHRYEPDLNATYQETGHPLRHRPHPRAPLQAPRQGEGRSGRAAGRALDHRGAAPPTLHVLGAAQ